MINYWDEFSKSLAEPLPRRESLRRLGLVLTGAVLSPMGLASASAGHHAQDPCKAFCRCRNGKQQDQCLKACKACNKNTSRIAGSCGNYVCCGAGQASCGSYCAGLADDPYNCGACGFECDPPGPYEYGACISGSCAYRCIEGAIVCDGACTPVSWDPNNCGDCGNVCGGPTPYCNDGVCSECRPGLTWCGGYCAYLWEDPVNCGACGNVCPIYTTCIGGTCQDNYPPDPNP